jgi:tRNA1(Val) A37 N6-methylase TrmN6
VGEGASAGLPKNPDVEVNRQHLIRLITRLIFVWFLKQKDNLIPEWIFKESEVAEVLKTFDPHSEKKSNYYNGIIQNLFFATLNKEIVLRGFTEKETRKDYGIKTVYRDHKDSPLFKISQEEFIKKFETVPFLNGGLFECLDRRDSKEKQKYVDGFSREKSRAAFVPNCLFFGEGVSGEHGAHEGIIELFSRYNFTVEENTPQDIDIALDPELLGKVFENLLGTYNEETKSTARNESGSFYTPREIVDYMVETSLKEYFKGKLTPPDEPAETELKEKLDKLFSYHETRHDFDTGQVKLLMDAINNCKILDPACGSGAFPMGVLNKLTFIMEKLDPDNKLWEELQIQKAKEETEEAFRIGDRDLREKRLKEISDVFELNKKNYGRKLFLIENCIFGIDIQPIAIQISKLRFFISLIVDQKTGGAKENNYNVLPLPNLETKFVAANTLIGVKRIKKGEQGELTDQEIEKKQQELLVLRHKHFSARKVDEKIALREQDEVLSKYLADLLKENRFYSAVDAAQMAAWNPYDQTKPSDFFDAYWMFGIKDGFDVVIGNPPYIGEKGHKTLFEPVKNSILKEFYVGKMDYFYFFFHLAINILQSHGILSFITTNYYITATGGKKLRQDLKTRTSLLYLVNFNEFRVFDSAQGQHNMITVLQKSFNKGQICNCYTVNKIGIASAQDLKSIFDGIYEETNYSTVKQLDIYEGMENYIRMVMVDNNDTAFSIFEKIKNQNKCLGEICNVNTGIMGGCDYINNSNLKYLNHNDLLKNDIRINDGVFVLDKRNERDTNMLNSINNSNILKPFFKNSDINKYSTSIETDKILIFSSKNLEIDKNIINRHLIKYKKILRKIREINNENLDDWCFLRRGAAHPSIFSSSKIVAPQRSKTNTFGYNEIDWYASADVYFITTKDTSFKLRYILMLLNSKLYYFWLYNKGKRKGETLELYQKPLSEIPIKQVSSQVQDELIVFVDKIIDTKMRNPKADISGLERQIDNLVYRLYNLTLEEVRVIEPGFPLSRAEYEGIGG